MFSSSNLYSLVPLFPKNRLMFPCSLRYFANVPLFPKTSKKTLKKAPIFFCRRRGLNPFTGHIYMQNQSMWAKCPGRIKCTKNVILHFYQGCSVPRKRCMKHWRGFSKLLSLRESFKNNNNISFICSVGTQQLSQLSGTQTLDSI